MAHYVTDADVNLIKIAGNYSPKQRDMFLIAHPIGSYYITEESETPVDKYGGGWLQIQGKFLLGADGSIYKVGDADGGEATHTLTVNEMPSHTHNSQDAYVSGGTQASRYALYSLTSDRTGWGNLIGYSGGSQPHNNMPPYHIVNIWKRIS